MRSALTFRLSPPVAPGGTPDAGSGFGSPRGRRFHLNDPFGQGVHESLGDLGRHQPALNVLAAQRIVGWDGRQDVLPMAVRLGPPQAQQVIGAADLLRPDDHLPQGPFPLIAIRLV